MKNRLLLQQPLGCRKASILQFVRMLKSPPGEVSRLL